MIRTVDLFAGCGGLTEGFAQTGYYETCACVEWEIPQCINLRERLKTKWNIDDANERVIRFDIRRTAELLSGFDDSEYGRSKGLGHYCGSGIDLVIGGPPCQAYSIAGRIRDEHGMKKDYRNFLFESYLEVVKALKPKAFVFENVPGLLSAKPGDRYIVDIIREEFSEAGYEIANDLHIALVDVSDYGVPQKRKRIIILGLRKEIYGSKSADVLKAFYSDILPKYKAVQKLTLRDAIGDLPALYPSENVNVVNGVKTAHTVSERRVQNHISRYHNKRDIELFRILAEDIESGENKYASVESRKELYTQHTGHESNIHKYHVLKWEEPSTTIPAHLCKDGLRHIHPDPKQARTITVREAARIQTFPDDYIFLGAMTDAYKMIGNAVPPEFARRLALAVEECVF